jgi:hypothetical protein
MSSLVEPIVVGAFQQEKKDEPEELGGHQMLSATETNISFEQDKPWCMMILLLIESFIIYACKCIVHLRIGFE